MLAKEKKIVISQPKNNYTSTNMSDVQVLTPPNSELFASISQFDHELVLFCNDNTTGLKAIIAVHNTTLGPALGGLRMWNYKSDHDALFDVLRLSRGMTYKSAVAGLNLGGGKAVIIGDARTQKSEALLRRFGKFVNNLAGKYITAEDVGIGVQDIETVLNETPHVAGLADKSGDPSPFTAYGTYLSIKASMKKLTGSDSLVGKKVMVQGTGHVGLYLVEHLVKEGATVLAYDIYEDNLKAAVATGATAVSGDVVYSSAVDVYAPCALGATLNPDTIPQLKCAIVAGAANNQLLDEVRDGQALQDRKILYAPDFVANAGGIINVFNEVQGNYRKERSMRMTENIYNTVLNVYATCDAQGILPQQAAIAVAEKRIKEVGHIRLFN